MSSAIRLTITAMAVAALVACGGDGGATPTGPTTTAQATDTPSASAPTPTDAAAWPGDDATPSAPSSSVPTAAELAGSLATPTDLGPGCSGRRSPNSSGQPRIRSRTWWWCSSSCSPTSQPRLPQCPPPCATDSRHASPRTSWVASGDRSAGVFERPGRGRGALRREKLERGPRRRAARPPGQCAYWIAG